MVYLFNLVEIVLRIFIQDKLSNLSEREIRMRPHFGHVKGNFGKLACRLFVCHGLLHEGNHDSHEQICMNRTHDVHGPMGKVFVSGCRFIPGSFDGIIQQFGAIIGISTSELGCLSGGESL